MGNYIDTFITLLFLSSLLTFIAAVVAWRRSVRGLESLTYLLLAMGIWSASYAFEWLPMPSGVKSFQPNITYIGIVAVPGFFLVFALAFTNYGSLLTKRLFLALCIEPAITLLLVWTNKYHHLVFTSMIHRLHFGFTQPEILHGSWYYVNLAYSYLLITAGFAALVIGYLRSHPSMKKRFVIILAAALVPWTGNIFVEFFLAT